MKENQFSIRPKLNRVTFYTVVPYMTFYLAFNVFGNKELTSGSFAGYMFLLCVILLVLFIKSLLTPWLSQISINGHIISKVTNAGGIIKIDLRDLNVNECKSGKFGMIIVPNSGEPLLINGNLFSIEDLNKLYHHITPYFRQ